jgi:DNA repair protein RadC
MNIKLTPDEKSKPMNPMEVFEIMKRILMRENKIDRNREHFWVISLSNARKILNIELISMGSATQTIAEPMEVFSIPLQKKAITIILVHNHPSGNLMPSPQDKDLTNQLIQCGELINIKIVDHFIISPTGYYSFAETGLLEELAESLKYVPQYKIRQRIEKERVEGEGRGEDRKARAMAKAMKEKGYKITEIVELTGLSKHVISRLK